MSAPERAAVVDAGRRTTIFAYYLAFVGLGLAPAHVAPALGWAPARAPDRTPRLPGQWARERG